MNWKLLLMTLAVTSTAFADFDATIPVLDMNEYFNPETKGKFVDELASALKDVGFFAVVNTGVDKETLDQGYQAITDYFGQSKEQKMKMFIPQYNGQRGYVPGESAKGRSDGDVKEFYHVGRELNTNAWPNVWPDDFNLKDPLYKLFAALETYMPPLEMAMAEAIGERSDLFTEMTVEGDCLLRAIHYPANPPPDTVWAGEHTDIDLFTILPRATAEGLQVKNQQGEWIDIKVPENAFIINAGDMLENITNGEFKSGVHRVIAKASDYERYSMVLFVHPRSKDSLDPLAGCIERTGGVRRYSNATRLELLEERLVDLGLASYEMMKHLAASGFMERQIEVGRSSLKAMNKLKDAGLASDAVLIEIDRLSTP